MRKTLSATIAALGLLAVAMPAWAGTLSAPGVYYGTGNATDSDWIIDTGNGVELGVEAINRFAGPITPTGNVYQASLGDIGGNPANGSIWGFAFSARNTTGLLSAITLSMSITDYSHGTTVTFDPKTFIGDNAGTDNVNTVGGGPGCSAAPASSACAAGSQTGIQNAETLSFPQFDPLFNSNLDDTYLITLTASSPTGAELAEVSALVNAGAGAALPEPASMALVGTGLIGLGSLRRRRRG